MQGTKDEVFGRQERVGVEKNWMWEEEKEKGKEKEHRKEDKVEM